MLFLAESIMCLILNGLVCKPFVSEVSTWGYRTAQKQFLTFPRPSRHAYRWNGIIVPQPMSRFARVTYLQNVVCRI